MREAQFRYVLFIQEELCQSLNYDDCIEKDKTKSINQPFAICASWLIVGMCFDIPRVDKRSRVQQQYIARQSMISQQLRNLPKEVKCASHFIYPWICS